MPFTIIKGDITTMKVDAIVNAANRELQMGGGVCGAIFKAAGINQLQKACDKLAPIKVGEAVITLGYDLPAKYIIHAVGPIYKEYDKKQSEQHLRNAYNNALELAVNHDCNSIAFPLISSGIYGYPKADALKVATNTIENFLKEHEISVTLVLFDKDSSMFNKDINIEIDQYLENNYNENGFIKTKGIARIKQLNDVNEDLNNLNELTITQYVSNALIRDESSLDQLINNLDESFSQMLFKLIDAKGMEDIVVYKKANLDRKLFSKIKSNIGYIPSKRTVIALAIALELNLVETDSFLERAGYALSHAIKFDVIIEFFIVTKRYNIYEINQVLFEYDQPLLGS